LKVLSDSEVAPTQPSGEGCTAALIGIAHVVLRVDDWKRTATWYQEVLGFERRKGDGFVGLVRPGASFVLLFRPTGSPIAPSSTPTERLEHMALLVPSAADLEGWRSHLETLGIDAPIDRQPVGASITLHDPDGLEVELFCPAEGSPLAVGVGGVSTPAPHTSASHAR